MEYKLNKFNDGVILINNSERLCIPFNSDNKDYQEYLKWIAKGNTPLPADAGEANASNPADEQGEA